MSKKSGIPRLRRLTVSTWAMWACFTSCLPAQTFRLDSGAKISFLSPPGPPEEEDLEGQFTLVHEEPNPFMDSEYFRVTSFFLRATETGRVFTLESMAATGDPILVATGEPGSFLVNFPSGAAVPSVVLSGWRVPPQPGFEGFSIQHKDPFEDGTWTDNALTPSRFTLSGVNLYKYHLNCSADGCLVLQPFAVLNFTAQPVGEELLHKRAGMLKYPIGAPLLEGEDKEGPPLFKRLEYFIKPRAFPAESIDFQERLRAFEELGTLRGSIPHTPVGYSDTPLSPGTTITGTCAWYQVGPTNINGRVTSIAVDPTDNKRIFVTTVGGIWRSKTGGREWERVSDDFLSTVFASVAINPINSNEVFAGAGDPNYHASVPVYVGGSGIGIWRSVSGGDRGLDNWKKVSPDDLDNQVIARIRIDPLPPHNVYAATSNGVYLGTRTKATDPPVFARLGTLDGNTTDIAVDFKSTPRIIYAGVAPGSSCAPASKMARGIWKWNGSKWSKKDDGIPTTSSGIISLSSPSKSNALVLYAKVSAEVKKTTRLQGIYKTENGGEGRNAWKALPATATDPTMFPATKTDETTFAWYNNFIEIDPNDFNRVYTGSIDLWRSTDGGKNWSRISAGTDTGFPFKLHEDQHAVAFDDAGNIYVANDGGLARTNYTSPTLWHWDDISHGMVVTEFYRMTRQQAKATVIAGGSQDNGTEISFGNQTWYNPYKCDGFSVAIDAKNSDSLYATCNCTPLAIANPVPYSTPGDDPPVPWYFDTECLSNLAFTDPIVTDPWKAGAALSMATTPSSQPYLVRTTDGKTWCTVPNGASPFPFPIGKEGVDCVTKSSTTVSSIAIAPYKEEEKPALAFKVYYIGLIDTGVTKIWRTIDGGKNWVKDSVGLPSSCTISTCPATSGPPRVNAIVVDWKDHLRAYAGLGGCGGRWGGVYMTTDGGANWTPLLGSETGVLPVAPITGLAVDPVDQNVIYASNTVGVYKGKITPGIPPAAAWEPFDQGLPNGLDVSDLWVNAETKVLSIGTIGHGAYERHLDPMLSCPGAMLLVRDNVFDRATIPSPYGEPDPEHPILDSSRPGFYKPDDTEAGKVYWWDSTDIRIDVPTAAPEKNKISNIALAAVEGDSDYAADHVEFQTCPIELAYGYCPPGTLWDSSPQPEVPAKFYVQVTNRGLVPASNVKVIALWTDATLNLPLLPSDFWTNVFPSDPLAPAAPTLCGALSEGVTGWNSLGCKTIPVVNPEHPEVVSFDWVLPREAVGRPCMMAMVDSVSDPIPRTEFDPSALAPDNRQITVRNLHVIDVLAPPAPPSPLLPLVGDYPGMERTKLPNPRNSANDMQIFISKPSMPNEGKVGILLPKGIPEILSSTGAQLELQGIELDIPVKLTAAQKSDADTKGFDTSVMYVTKGDEGSIGNLPAPDLAQASWDLAVFYHPGNGIAGTSSRFALLAKQGGQIAAGSTYILRYRSPCDTHCLGLQVSGPPGNCPGEYTVRAAAGDDSGDVISYTFKAASTTQTFEQGPMLEPVATFVLGAGTWTLSVKVSDLKESTPPPTCPQTGTDGICSETIEVGPTDPLPPTDVAAAGGTREVTVSWSVPECGVDPMGYRVLRSVEGAPFSVAADMLTGDRVFTDVSLEDDTEYCYVVRPKSGLANVKSDEACARTFGLMPPTNVMAAAGGDSVTVTWSPPSGVEPSGYRVLRGAADGSYNVVGDVPKVFTSYTDMGLAAYKEYCYVVQTKSESATSVYSGEACAKTLPTFRRCDCDGNDHLNITDPIVMLNYLFNSGPKPRCLKGCDFDDSGLVRVTDAIGCLIYLFRGGLPPEPPFPNCGEDPTPDALDCQTQCI